MYIYRKFLSINYCNLNIINNIYVVTHTRLFSVYGPAYNRTVSEISNNYFKCIRYMHDKHTLNRLRVHE
jgi:hypothetical protein